jgi:membrane protein DedA with SNARE-associated domain
MADVGHVLGMIEPLIHQYGAPAVLAILALESLGLPLPGESLLIVAAVFAGRGDLSFPSLIMSAWVGSVIGDNVGYLIGKNLGRSLLAHYGGKIGLDAERLRKVEALFARYGPLTVGFARFFNVLRQLNGVVAGSLEMHWLRFLAFNALGGAAWVLVWSMAGYYIGSHGIDIAAALRKLGIVGTIVASITLVAALIYLWRHRVAAKSRREIAPKRDDC